MQGLKWGTGCANPAGRPRIGSESHPICTYVAKGPVSSFQIDRQLALGLPIWDALKLPQSYPLTLLGAGMENRSSEQGMYQP